MIKYLLGITLLVCMSGCSTVRSTKLLAPDWFGFSKIDRDVYVDNQMPDEQRQEFARTLNLARGRVAGFFGGIEGGARVFACATEACFVSHGGVGAEKGKAYGEFMLLLSPRGLDAVIVSHELTHIELSHRVGTIRTWRAIPSWFQEGLAVFVSEDPRYTENAWLKATDDGRNAPALNAIGAMLGKGDWQLSYGTARRKVGNWYRRAGRPGLEMLIAQVKAGNDFDSTFNAMPAPQSIAP